MDNRSRTSTTATGRKPDEMPELPLLGDQIRWNTAKVILRSICLGFDAIAMGLVISLCGGRDIYAATALLLTAPIAGLSIMWNTAELIVICVRRDKSRGIKPAAHVACDLLLWLGSLVCTGWMSWYAGLYTSQWEWIYQLSDDDIYQYRHWLPILDAICGMEGLITVLHFVLFVRVCVEVDRRSKDRRMQELIIAMTHRGHNPRDYPLATLEQAAHSGWGLPDNESQREFVTKYNHIAAPVPEMDSNPPTGEVGGESSSRGEDITHAGELPVRPDDAGINQKVLIDDVIREARARAR